MLSAMGIEEGAVRPPQPPPQAQPQAPVQPRPPAGPDAGRILASVGEAAYEWDLRTDTLTWSANVGEVLGTSDPEVLASGRQYARLLDPHSAHTRFDAVARSELRDDGRGVAYQIEYCLDLGAKLW